LLQFLRGLSKTGANVQINFDTEKYFLMFFLKLFLRVFITLYVLLIYPYFQALIKDF